MRTILQCIIIGIIFDVNLAPTKVFNTSHEEDQFWRKQISRLSLVLSLYFIANLFVYLRRWTFGAHQANIFLLCWCYEEEISLELKTLLSLQLLQTENAALCHAVDIFEQKLFFWTNLVFFCLCPYCLKSFLRIYTLLNCLYIFKTKNLFSSTSFFLLSSHISRCSSIR